ncbi:glycosyltransferase [Paenibacillus sp. 1001270B_150601_E10]|uniref:glycosyltransferase n=1 Tax=Paenibacillus sp. 1001270B_150601_E10 TaxID=2787079 RepID=UPI001E5294AF|nr:glycosyltransferase [Paenibacillus sp. 1001270B_150601_E10]
MLKKEVLLILQLVWQGNVFDFTGYAKATRQYVMALHESGVDVKIEAFHAAMPEIELPSEQRHILKHLTLKRKTRTKRRVYVLHSIPDLWKRKLHPTIGFTYWETSKIPDRWVNQANQMSAMFLPSANNMEVFRSSGVRVPMYHIRPCLHIPQGSAEPHHTPPYLEGLPPFRFLAVSSWIERKGIDRLLRAYWEEFRPEDPVCLVIKTAAGPELHQAVEHMKREFGIQHSTAPIYLDLEFRSEWQMDALYRHCQAFVHVSRGEGVGYPMLEAAVRGLPIIATGWGGHTDFLNEYNSYPVPFTFVPVKPQHYYDGYQSDQLWAECSIEALRFLMRHVVNNYSEAATKGLFAKQAATSLFTPREAAQDMIKALSHMTGIPVV